jgi:hypothetical protein
MYLFIFLYRQLAIKDAASAVDEANKLKSQLVCAYYVLCFFYL